MNKDKVSIFVQEPEKPSIGEMAEKLSVNLAKTLKKIVLPLL